MNNIIENKEQQFANGQVCRNLGVNSEATEPEAEFEAVNAIERRLGCGCRRISRSNRQASGSDDHE